MSVLYTIVVALCLTTFLYIIRLFKTQRYVFLAPAAFFSFLYHIFLQLPMLLYFPEISILVGGDSAIIIFLSSFPLVALYLSTILSGRHTKAVFDNIRHARRPNNTAIFAVSFMAIICIGLYLLFVTPTATGLYVVFTSDDSIQKTIAREESRKLLPEVPRYAQAIGATVLSAMLSICACWSVADKVRASGAMASLPHLLFVMIIVVVSMMFAAIDGARAPGSGIIVCIVLFFFIKGNLTIVKAHIIIIVLACAVIVALQVLRSDDESIFDSISIVVDRVVYVCLMTGIETIGYAERNGYFGIGAIPKLAAIFGVEPVNAGNEVCRYLYPNSPIGSGLANCCFVFSYYAYFGLMALPVVMSLVALLDVMLIIIVKFVDPTQQTLALVGVLYPMIMLVSMDYSIVFITGGCLPWLAICIMFAKPKQNTNQSTTC